MLMQLDFNPDAATRAAGSASQLVDRHPALVRWMAFRIPVRFEVADLLLLDPTPHDFGVVRDLPPLLDIATWALQRLHALPDPGSFRYDCGVHGPFVNFERHADRVRLSSSIGEASVEVEYVELIHIWESFTERVRQFLRQVATDLRRNPYWGAWLDGTTPQSTTTTTLMDQVRLAFHPDDAAMEAVRQFNLRDTPLVALAYTLFELPIEFHVGNTDIFGAPLRLPALDLAVTGLGRLDFAARYGRGVYLTPESSPFIRFELAGPQPDASVLVHYSSTDVVAEVPFSRLHGAWRDFKTQVCAYLVDHVPELQFHPEWPAFISDG
jgi:hypothetical protein